MIRAEHSRTSLHNFITEGIAFRFRFAFLCVFDITDAGEMISADLLNSGICIAQLFSFQNVFFCCTFFCQLLLIVCQIFKLLQEVRIDHRQRVNLFQRHTGFNSLKNGKDPAVVLIQETFF